MIERSHLTTDAEYGAPAYDDVAHRFQVQMYAADVPDDEARRRVRAVIDREKPAHTSYHLCVIDARMRVGFQARLGVDAIVAASSQQLSLGSGLRLSHEGVLADIEGTSLAYGSGAARETRLGRRSALV